MGTYLYTSFREPIIELVSWGQSVSLLLVWYLLAAGAQKCVSQPYCVPKLTQPLYAAAQVYFTTFKSETFCFQKEFSLSLTLHAFNTW